jgi:hypothetical protein
VLGGGVKKKNLRKRRDWLERGDCLGKENKGRGRKVYFQVLLHLFFE